MAPESSRWGGGFHWTLTFTSEVLVPLGHLLAGLLVLEPRRSWWPVSDLQSCRCPSWLAGQSAAAIGVAFAQGLLGKRRRDRTCWRVLCVPSVKGQSQHCRTEPPPTDGCIRHWAQSTPRLRWVLKVAC